MNNPLTRGILRLSKRSKSGSSISDRDSIISGVSDVSNMENGDWTKYDERLIDCINRSDISKLKDVLKKKGVSPVKVSRVGKTAIHIAVKKRCMAGVDIMLLEHPDISCLDTQGRTVYHIAAINGDTIMLKKLVDYSKWNLDIKDVKGMTALHYAVQSGELQCTKILLQNDCPIDSQDAEGRTALLLAAAENRDKMATTLIEHGADVNVEDKQRKTAIVIACSLGMTNLVSLLLSKGADKSVIHRASINLGKLASDAGHSDIVELLKKEMLIPSDENGNNHEDDNDGDCHGDCQVHVNGQVNGESVSNHDNGDISVNDHIDLNGHSEVFIDISIDNSFDNKNESEIIENGGDGDRKYSTPIPRLQVTQCSAAVRRSMYSDENSLTSSIIESLMSLDGKSDTTSETSVTEDQLHEKEEEERKELTSTLAQKELCIEELHAEIESLKNKVTREMEFRFSAEKEVQQLKLDLETKSQRSECESEQASMMHDYISSEKLPNGNYAVKLKMTDDVEELHSNAEDDKGEEEEKEDEDEDNQEKYDEEEQEEDEDEDKDEDEDEDDDDDEDENGGEEEEVQRDKVVHIDSDVDVYSSHDSESDSEKMHDGHIPGSDTDDSVSDLTGGYRKKSLGTAKHHINMLEERVLCLEDELSYKNEEISQLEAECKNTKEFLELNNKTAVPLEIHNELKSDSRKDRNAFKEQIASLEEKVMHLEESASTGENTLMGTEVDKSDVLVPAVEIQGVEIEAVVNDLNDNETLLCCGINRHADLEYQVCSLNEKVNKLQDRLSDYDNTTDETVCCYRDNLIALYQNNLDSTLEEILGSIVKLRTS